MNLEEYSDKKEEKAYKQSRQKEKEIKGDLNLKQDEEVYSTCKNLLKHKTSWDRLIEAQVKEKFQRETRRRKQKKIQIRNDTKKYKKNNKN